MNRTHSDEDSAGYLTRKGAAGYLSKKLGRKVTVSSLHRHASEGTGPPYVLILNHASYQRVGLDAWVEALAKAPPQRPRAGKGPLVGGPPAPENRTLPKDPPARRRRRPARAAASAA
jgi:hypothetical protein